LEYHQKRERGESSSEIAERLIKAGFAKPSKSKAGKGGIVTEVGPVVAEKRPRLLRVDGRQKNSAPTKRARNSPKKRKSFSKESSRIADGRKNIRFDRDATFNDTRRSHKKKSKRSWSRHRQCKPRKRITSSQAPNRAPKFDKAKELGIRILDEAAFRKML